MLQFYARTADIPVMMLTARVDRADRQAWLDVGVRAVPATPFDLLPLRAQLREVLGWTA